MTDAEENPIVTNADLRRLLNPPFQRSPLLNRLNPEHCMKFLPNPKTALLALVLAASLQTASAAPPFRMVGYWTTWGGQSPSTIPYGKLTHVYWTGIGPNSDGSLGSVDSSLSTLVSLAHNANVQVGICIQEGGNGNFPTIAASQSLTNTFANNVANLVNQYGLDGADIDWEFPTNSTQTTNMGNLMSTLYYTLHYYGKWCTAAVKCWNGSCYPDSLITNTDWLNSMNYDNVPDSQQSTYADQQTSYNYWVGTRGCPASKLVMGVPFYANPWNANQFSYSKILSWGASPSSDTFTTGGITYGYNGIPTVQDKVSLAYQERLGGMMFWTLNFDATGQNSLVTAMDSIVRANVVPVGSVISLQAGINNLWVSATNNGASALIAQASTPSNWETFTVIDESPAYGQGYIALRSLTNGLYVSAGTGGNGNLTANKSTVSNTEAFYWQPNGYGTIQLQCLANGLWVSATNAGASALVANASTPKSWETYNLKLWNAGRFETEGLQQSATAGIALTVNADSNMSGGAGMNLASAAVGNQMTFVIPYVEAGSYDVKIGVKKYNSRGIVQLAIAGSNGTYYNLGSAQDCYAATATYSTIDLGTWSPGSNSAKSFKFTVTGKNASSTGYSEMIDFITLTPQ